MEKEEGGRKVASGKKNGGRGIIAQPGEERGGRAGSEMRGRA